MNPGQVQQCRDNIQVANQGLTDPSTGAAWIADEKWYVDGFLVHLRTFIPEAVRSLHIAMVTGVDNDGIVPVVFPDRVDHTADFPVDVAVTAVEFITGGLIDIRFFLLFPLDLLHLRFSL